jgi:signal transduction histidine kinase
VSTALSRFVASGLIDYDRRDIVVSDVQGLRKVACECVDTLRSEFDRLLGSPLSADGPAPPAPDTSAERAGIAVELMREVAGRLLMSSLHEHEMRERAETTNEERVEALTLVEQDLRQPLLAILEWCTILEDRRDAVTSRVVLGIRRSASVQLEALDHLATLLAAAGPVS